MRYVSKDFLSQSPDESGSIICTIRTIQVKDMSQYTVNRGGKIEGSIQITDCSRMIELDFYAEGQRGFEKRLAKLDLFIEKLNAMRHQYTHMWENHQRDIAHYVSINPEKKNA